MIKLKFIEERNIISIEHLLKGWSNDKKYVLKDINDKKYLLRISDASLYDKKKNQFELLQKLELLDIYCSRPIEFGILDDGNVYMLISYLEGVDGIEAISKMSDKEAYTLGIEAGKILQKLHSIPVLTPKKSWWNRYQEKMPRKIEGIINCEYKIPNQEEIIKYYKLNSYLMEERPLLFAHGDYHLGNMIVKDGIIGIIDFDKIGVNDPYDEFKPFCWNVMQSEYFETGLINEYFNNKILHDFLKILKFYTAETLISQMPWSVKFGEEEIKTAYEVARNQMIWYGDFKLEIPTWYKGIIK